MTDRYTAERIMEIITWVVGSHDPGTPIGKLDVSELSKRGYTDSEISAALSWILERGEAPHAAPLDSSAFRMLHPLEADVITPDGWGILLSYHNLGFLSNADLEQIIERAMVMGTETVMDVAEIRALVAVYVMYQEQQLLDGGRSQLSGTEAVN
ncbi:MAG: DUF494 family protein [Bradyrhizobiaceae bacterium]|nr:DUF494 family protein [Bradyrhizobiaceae bacterium]